MDEYLILKFNNQTQAISSRETQRLMCADWNESQGFTVLRGQDAINHVLKFDYVFTDTYAPMVVIGQKNGVDNFDALGTVTWSNEIESPDGIWYLSSLSNDIKFPNWKDFYAQYGGVEYEEVAFPSEWQEEENV